MRRYEPKYESVEVEITTPGGGSSYGQYIAGYGGGGSSYSQFSTGYGPAETSIRASGVGASVRNTGGGNTGGGNTGDMLFGIF